MPEFQPIPGRGFEVRRDRPLIGIPTREDDHEAVCYFTDEEDAEAASPAVAVQRTLSLLGAWSDIDADNALDELDRIRHGSKPTPPIDL